MSHPNEKHERLIDGTIANQQRLENLVQALKLSDERFQLVFEQIPSGILVTSAERIILMANPPALRWLGLTEEALGTSLDRWIEDADVLLRHQRRPGAQAVELLAADGKTRLLGATNVPVKLPSSHGVVTVFRDIGKLKEAEERRRHTEQLVNVGTMVAMLGHEIKNPLASLLAGLQVLEREIPSDTDLGSVVTDLIGDVRRLSGVIGELLDTARPSEMSPAPLSLSRLLAERIESLSELASGRGVELSLSGQDEDAIVVADSTLLQRAVGNLLLNAIDAAGRGGSVWVSWWILKQEDVERIFKRFTDRVVAVEVKDSGPGIPRETSDDIFKPFFTTKTTGSGLGLSITREIIETHGGVIEQVSEHERGAVFRIYLATGEPLPCWDVNPAAEDRRCEQCSVCKIGSGYCCWTLRRHSDSRGPAAGQLKRECLSCQVYNERDLVHHCQLPHWSPTSVLLAEEEE